MPKENANLEVVVASIWQELLKTPTVGTADNFLDFGGTSLRAGQFAARVRQELGVEIPVDVILSEESFGTLCRTVSAMLEEEQGASGPAEP